MNEDTIQKIQGEILGAADAGEHTLGQLTALRLAMKMEVEAVIDREVCGGRRRSIRAVISDALNGVIDIYDVQLRSCAREMLIARGLDPDKPEEAAPLIALQDASELRIRRIERYMADAAFELRESPEGCGKRMSWCVEQITPRFREELVEACLEYRAAYALTWEEPAEKTPQSTTAND